MIEIKEESEEEYGEGNTIQEIVLRQIKKIGDICSQELTGGYITKKPTKIEGGIIITEEYHKDLREAYCEAIDFIIDLVYPAADKQFKELIKNEESKELSEIKEKLKNKKKIFREINLMFERTQFFKNKNYGNE